MAQVTRTAGAAGGRPGGLPAAPRLLHDGRRAGAAETPAAGPRVPSRPNRWGRRAAGPLLGYAAAAAGVAAVSLGVGGVLSRLPGTNLSMVYLLVVLATAVEFGRGPASAASLASFLVYNWFFTPPLHTFAVNSPEEWIALLLLLVASAVAGQLAAALRQRGDEALRREREARALHELGRLLSGAEDLDAALGLVATHLRWELSLAGCAVLTPAELSPVRPMAADDRGSGPASSVVYRAAAGAPPVEDALGAEWLTAGPRTAAGGAPRRWIRIRRPTRGGSAPPGTAGRHRQVRFVPLKAGEQTVGMLRLAVDAPDARERRWTPEEARLISAAADLIGLVIERDRLRQEATQAEILRQTEEARQAVLASVSHDLRTPLASIKAFGGSLLQQDVTWTAEERRGFAEGIVEEADRLHQLVEHLLDMSRIEAGAIQPARDWYPLDALVDDVVGQLRARAKAHRIEVDVPEQLPPVPLDYIQVGVVLTNLIDNAIKYSPPGATVRIAARPAGGDVRVSVTDDGPGVPPEALERVFEKFYRVHGGDTSRTKGLGLGLAIARGLVQAHGGTIWAESPPAGAARGTSIGFTLPLHPAGIAWSGEAPGGGDAEPAESHAGAAESPGSDAGSVSHAEAPR